MSALDRIRETLLGRATPETDDGAGTPVPVVVGVGRSGTTLLRLMLDAHPEMAIPPETHFVPQVIRAAKDLKDPRQKFVEIVTGHRTWGDYGLTEAALAEAVERAEPDPGSALRAFYRLYAAKFGKVRWGDKTPLYVRHMKEIQEVLPEARFVHVIRDGRDVALSSREMWFGPDSVKEAAVWWRDWILSAREQSESLDHYLEVRYENLVRNTEPTLKEVCDFLELPWNPAMLDYHLTSDERMQEIRRDVPSSKGDGVVRGEDRAGIHALTGKPPDKGRIGRWRDEMDPDELRLFEKDAGKLLRELGYRPSSGSTLLMNNRRYTKLQPRAEKLSEEVFVGSPPRYFESVGRLQLVTLLREGLYPDSKVLDVGCGSLRGGYWISHFLDPGCYFGIEPNREMLEAGIRTILEPGLIEEKRPRFDHNPDFDFSVFGERFDFVLARSVWTHASKAQIRKMLDSFGENSNEDALFLTSYIPVSEEKPDYQGDEWLGRSHESEVSGTVSHDVRWIEAECRERDLAVIEIRYPEYVANGQIWLKIRR